MVKLFEFFKKIRPQIMEFYKPLNAISTFKIVSYGKIILDLIL